MTVVFDDEELYTSVKVEAARRHVPAKDLVTAAVREWLELQEDLEDLEALREGADEYQREGGIDLEDVLKERGLEA
jgi:hypothetical protein